jgi:ubiquinone/menaquinone biosynthesis C-methylase UbiE
MFRYPTGRKGAHNLGYGSSDVAHAPSAVIEAFCGVGHPLSLESVRTDDCLLDVGCGSGFDLLVAAPLVGAGGRVCGIDITDRMVELAAEYLRPLSGPQADVCVAACEAIPFDPELFDIVISNGMLNLSPQKDLCLREVHRVLKPGGRFLLADMVLAADPPSEVAGSLEAWVQ